jgi:hypothetical protein
MDNIKIGDKVIFIKQRKPAFEHMTIGKFYTVTDINHSYPRAIRVKADNDKILGYFEHRFKKAYRDTKLARKMLRKVEGKDGYIWKI